MDYDAEREHPRLIMEYLPLGNLEEQHESSPITEWETVTLLFQGLDALAYLHDLKIAHRDLKPANILVQSRDNFYIKIADFGLAKDSLALTTFCGTKLYLAPEILKYSHYTAKVDIWSLGIIVFQFGYGLPEIRGRKFTLGIWYQTLARKIRDWDSDELLDFLSSSMLRRSPKNRLSARECLVKVAELRKTIIPARNSDTDHGTPTEKMSSSADEDAPVAVEARNRSGRRTEEYLKTTTQIWGPTLGKNCGQRRDRSSIGERPGPSKRQHKICESGL